MYEADRRQGERLLEALSLDGGCQSTATPGVKLLIEHLEKDKNVGPDRIPGTCGESEAPRAGQDRLAVRRREVCRFMSLPAETSDAALKRLGRYLLG